MKILIALGLLVSSVSFAQVEGPEVGMWKYQDKNISCPTCYYMANQALLKKTMKADEDKDQQQKPGSVRKGM